MAANRLEGIRGPSADSEMAGFVEATHRRAFGLAFRITGDVIRAESATEAAYRRLPLPPTEVHLFDLVRQEALMTAPDRAASAQVSARTSVAVRAAFQSLPQLERTVLELAYTGGMTVATIAALLEEAESTIRVALRTALLGTLAAVATD